MADPPHVDGGRNIKISKGIYLDRAPSELVVGRYMFGTRDEALDLVSFGILHDEWA